jgi:curved DNA-binding protein CbpA
MSEKPDHYEVLGLKKTATLQEIKSAYSKIVMRSHPDRVKHKTDMTEAQKNEAIARFKLATEAEKVLTDPSLRAAYDQYGHKGVENMAAGKAAGSGQTYEQAAGGRMKRGPFTEEDTLSFFENRAGRDTIGTSSGSGGASDGLTSAERRERARQERLKNRGKSDTSSPASSNDNSGSAANAFHDVADKVSDAAEKLRGNVAVPLEALEKFRENLADFLGEVDEAISRAKRSSGPRP